MTFPIPFSPHSLTVSQSIWLRQGFLKALQLSPIGIFLLYWDGEILKKIVESANQ